jgi:hypothetical protein
LCLLKMADSHKKRGRQKNCSKQQKNEGKKRGTAKKRGKPKQLRLSTMKTAFTLALAVGVASASNLRTVAGGDIKFLRANPGATGMSSGQDDKLPLCAQYCQGKPTTCEMAFEFMEPQGCGGSCPQAMKEQLLMEMGCSPDTAATGGGDPANVEGGANNYATGAATDGTMKDCGPYGPKKTFMCGPTCNMECMDESGGGTMDSMNADGTMNYANKAAANGANNYANDAAATGANNYDNGANNYANDAAANDANNYANDAAANGANNYAENQQFGATSQDHATQPLEGVDCDYIWTDCHGCTSTGGFCGTPSGLASGEQGGQTAKVYCGEQNCPRGAVNSGDAGPAHGQGDEFPPCAQTCQGKPTSCDMALEWMGYEGCGEHCDQTLKDQLLSAMGCTEATEKDATGVAANNAAIDASDSITTEAPTTSSTTTKAPTTETPKPVGAGSADCHRYNPQIFGGMGDRWGCRGDKHCMDQPNKDDFCRPRWPDEFVDCKRKPINENDKIFC